MKSVDFMNTVEPLSTEDGASERWTRNRRGPGESQGNFKSQEKPGFAMILTEVGNDVGSI
jgi:hypothetical protein